MINQYCNFMCSLTKERQKPERLKIIIRFLESKGAKPERFCEREVIKNGFTHSFEEFVNCKYGLVCPKTSEINGQLRSLGRQAEILLMSYFKENPDMSEVRELLRLMQGIFPAAYNRTLRYAGKKIK